MSGTTGLAAAAGPAGALAGLVAALGEYGPDIVAATGQTLYMVGLAILFATLAGVPIGTLLVIMDRGHIAAFPPLRALLALVVNIGRSIPFIILLIALAPFTRLLVGTSLGTEAAVPPMAVAATPFVARVVESALREVDRGTIDAAVAMGASPWQVVVKVLLPEALPSLVLGITIATVGLIEFSAVAGAVGGGGLGDLAFRMGYQRWEAGVLLACVVLLVALVQAVQWAGDTLARRLNHR